MSIVHKTLKAANYLGTTSVALYTAPVATTTHIKTILVHNISDASTYQVQLYLVPDGGTALASNKIYDVWLPPLETLMIDCFGSGFVLSAGESIQGNSDATSKVVCTMFGAEDDGA